jgi:hypothetical protein
MLFVKILESKIQGLSWEVPNHISEISLIVSSNPFLLFKSYEAIDDTIIGIDQSFLLNKCLLELQTNLNHLDWRGNSL